MKKELTFSMKRIVPQIAIQCTLDFESLSAQPVDEFVFYVSPQPAQEQECWWSQFELYRPCTTPGIYTIINRINGHFYVGSAKNLSERKYHHFSKLKADKHVNPYLQRAYNRHGADAFLFCILEHVDHAENLLEREQHFIDTLDPHYNIARVAGNTLGVKFTDEHKDKISASMTGKKKTPEARANMGKAQRGRKISPSHVAKREATKKSRRESGEHAPVVSPTKGKKLWTPEKLEAREAKRIATREAKLLENPDAYKRTPESL